MSLTLTALEGIPFIQPGDSLSDTILQSLKGNRIQLQDGDIFVLAQKIVSKAEGRLVNLNSVVVSEQAAELARIVEKDARFVQLVLDESSEILRYRPGTLIVVHKKGFVCANAGIDHSNVQAVDDHSDDWYLLLPEDCDRSAAHIRDAVFQKTGIRVGVLIIDSHGRAWRMGTVGVTIGLAGVPGLVDQRGWQDLFGYTLRITQVAAADELAAAASLMMGQANEGTPVVHVRGFPYPLREAKLDELIRPRELDMFR